MRTAFLLKLAVSVAALFAIAMVALSQEFLKHAPTLQSCTADINLWSSEIPGFPDPDDDQVRAATKSLTVREIEGRSLYMTECGRAYPALVTHLGPMRLVISALIELYDGEVTSRYFDFVERHGLSSKFFEEDYLGMR